MSLNMKEIFSQNKLDIKWKAAWASAGYRRLFFSGSILLAAVLFFYPWFFDFVQHRPGVVLHDALLAFLPAVDVSGYIFFLICLTVVIGLVRSLQSPYLYLIFLWGYLLVNVSRLITITLVPLEPPIGLMSLADPIAFPFYGQQGITKDLFYSGHTATLFLVFLVVRKKWEKLITLISTILIGFLLLVQHIHYTLDVLAAPVFVYGIYLLAKRIVFSAAEPGIVTSSAFKPKELI